MSKPPPNWTPASRLTRKEAAQVLGISVSMLDHLRREEVLACEKNPLTNAVRYVYADVARLKAQREAAGSVTTGKQFTRESRVWPTPR